MSRVGLNPVSIPEGVTVSVKGSNINIKGPKGELNQKFDPDFKIKIEENTLSISRPSEQKRHKSLHGLYRALIFNAVHGVSEGYELNLELVGVGYKASNQGNLLNLTLGYSHNIYFQVPEEIKVSTETVKGKPPVINLNGIDKQLIGQIAAKLKSLRPVEPYKGKGVKFVGEYVRRKVGKTAAA
jgi:large subunit ribosomal protein L6|tara:strand:+ start:9581 stop:10132 length:552 start_codon:yes stop_codon:yes gene_type:complete